MSATSAPIISRAEGEKLAKDYLSSIASSFLANDMTANKALMADTVSWDWSGDVKGEGTQADYYAVLAGSWQLVVSQFIHSNEFTVVDTKRGIICCTFDVVLIMDGRGVVPITEANTFQGKNLFELTVNAEKKVTSFRGVWDPLDLKLGTAFGAVMTAKAA